MMQGEEMENQDLLVLVEYAEKKGLQDTKYLYLLITELLLWKNMKKIWRRSLLII